jgi:transcriptional regulator with XRE-family HTH domain
MTKGITESLLDEIEKSGMSIKSISEKSGVSRTTIMGWINNGYTPSIENADFVLMVLGKRLEIGELSND